MVLPENAAGGQIRVPAERHPGADDYPNLADRILKHMMPLLPLDLLAGDLAQGSDVEPSSDQKPHDPEVGTATWGGCCVRPGQPSTGTVLRSM